MILNMMIPNILTNTNIPNNTNITNITVVANCTNGINPNTGHCASVAQATLTWAEPPLW